MRRANITGRRPVIPAPTCITTSVARVAFALWGAGTKALKAVRFVAIASLDDVDPNELAGSIEYVDGKHDHYDRAPEDIRSL